MNITEQICEEVRNLPEELAREVLDFIGYLEMKHQLVAGQLQNLKAAQQESMNHVWDNPEDEVWNEL